MKQILVQKEESVFKIHTDLDVENSTFLAKLLFQYVEQGKMTFELSSKTGSVVSEFTINVLGGLFSAVLYDLTKKIYTRLKEEKHKGREIKPVHIFLKDRQYTLTGDELDSLPEK
jgi:hypothetical protein